VCSSSCSRSPCTYPAPAAASPAQFCPLASVSSLSLYGCSCSSSHGRARRVMLFSRSLMPCLLPALLLVLVRNPPVARGLLFMPGRYSPRRRPAPPAPSFLPPPSASRLASHRLLSFPFSFLILRARALTFGSCRRAIHGGRPSTVTRCLGSGILYPFLRTVRERVAALGRITTTPPLRASPATVDTALRGSWAGAARRW